EGRRIVRKLLLQKCCRRPASVLSRKGSWPWPRSRRKPRCRRSSHASGSLEGARIGLVLRDATLSHLMTAVGLKPAAAVFTVLPGRGPQAPNDPSHHTHFIAAKVSTTARLLTL